MADRISRHAKERAAQRNLSYDDIALVMQYGQEIHRSGCTKKNPLGSGLHIPQRHCSLALICQECRPDPNGST